MNTVYNSAGIEELLKEIYDHSSTNIEQLDNCRCEYCEEDIEFVEDRSNRVDCDKGRTYSVPVTYHLSCYYKLLLEP